MSKVYPRHGAGGGAGAGGGQRIRSNFQQQQQRQQQQQQQQQQQRQQQEQQQRQYSNQRSQDDDYWPSLFTILCAIPVIFILYHYITKMISKLIWGSLTISVEVSGPRLNVSREERLYHWLLDWLAKNTKNLQNSTVRLKSAQDEYGVTEASMVRYPGFGVTQFKYKGAWIKLERIATPEVRCNDVPYEKIIMTFVSSRRNRSLLYELLEECKPNKSEETDKRTVVYGVDQCCWTEIGHPKRRRPLRSVVLSENVRGKMITDVKEFLKSEDWYVERGISYRRGYLLYGPPGCGKSSLVRGIAGEIGFDICILSLTAKGLTDDSLNILMNSTPENCIILLEDVDSAFRNRQDTAVTPEQNLSYGGASCMSTVTFGGLLNALDGVASTEGRLIFMTTNHVDKLDPALVRPGRVDMKMLVDYPGDDQLKGIFARFYSEAGIRMKSEFVKKVRELRINVTMAQIQGLFMFYKLDGQDAIDNIQEYFQDQFLMSELQPSE